MNSPFITALQNHCVTAHVEDCDHYRIHGGLAVETDYILVVVESRPSAPGPPPVPPVEAALSETTTSTFDTFRISKTFAAFRLLVQQLKQRCDQETKMMTTTTTKKKSSSSSNDDCDVSEKIIRNCSMIHSMVDTQRTTYLGKVNYMYVKVLSKQRVEIINHVLAIVLSQCYQYHRTRALVDAAAAVAVVPPPTSFSTDIATIIQTFFLTDHLMAAVDDDDNDDVAAISTRAAVMTAQPPPVVPVAETTTNNHDTNNQNPLLWIGDAVKNVASNVVNTATQTSALLQQPNTHSTSSTDIDSTTTAVGRSSDSYVVPLSQRSRRSIIERDIEETTLHQVAGQEAKLLIDDEFVVPVTTTATSDPTTTLGYVNQQRPKVPNYLLPIPTVNVSSTSTFGRWIDHNPFSFLFIAMVIVVGLRHAADIGISIDLDIFLLCIFASFCIGLHTPRPMILGYDDHPTANTVKSSICLSSSAQQQPTKVDRSGRMLLRQSMVNYDAAPTSVDTVGSLTKTDTTRVANTMPVQATTPLVVGSPMAMFPDGAELGSHLNCWSRPDPSIFHVRGPNYFQDRKKIPSSSEYIFPCRGIDLFLTDACPQNVGSKFSNILMGGKLRDIPTLIINFRLPWGILLFYCEISTKFVPFLDASVLYGTDEYTTLVSTKLQSILDEMTPGDRTVARWCMNNSEYKNKALKIVPVVVDGPWVVKSVVGGKPAIIGSKLPISYVYQPSDGSNQASYLEADLDIAASSAARGILSVARSYTQILTLNLGFVIQSNEQDELPEQMLTGARLHGIDPLTAPSLPLMQDDIVTAAQQQLSNAPVLTDEESDAAF